MIETSETPCKISKLDDDSAEENLLSVDEDSLLYDELAAIKCFVLMNGIRPDQNALLAEEDEEKLRSLEEEYNSVWTEILKTNNKRDVENGGHLVLLIDKVTTAINKLREYGHHFRNLKILLDLMGRRSIVAEERMEEDELLSLLIILLRKLRTSFSTEKQKGKYRFKIKLASFEKLSDEGEVEFIRAFKDILGTKSSSTAQTLLSIVIPERDLLGLSLEEKIHLRSFIAILSAHGLRKHKYNIERQDKKSLCFMSYFRDRSTSPHEEGYLRSSDEFDIARKNDFCLLTNMMFLSSARIVDLALKRADREFGKKFIKIINNEKIELLYTALLTVFCPTNERYKEYLRKIPKEYQKCIIGICVCIYIDLSNTDTENIEAIQGVVICLIQDLKEMYIEGPDGSMCSESLYDGLEELNIIIAVKSGATDNENKTGGEENALGLSDENGRWVLKEFLKCFVAFVNSLDRLQELEHLAVFGVYEEYDRYRVCFKERSRA